MSFSEKLVKLRKEKGLSQEALAEQLNTTRQAVSKWENGQGYPETEKLLMIGNIFEVTVDYLLKDTVESSNEADKGYYVSKEMAEGYLMYAHKIAKYVALGFGLLILSGVPYLVFRQEPIIYTILIIIVAAVGIGMFISVMFMDDNRYNRLSKEVLMFDEKVHKELADRYEHVKKKYAAVMTAGICLIVAGAIPFLFERKHITDGELVPYYPICVVSIAVGAYLFIRTVSIIDSYNLLVMNEQYTNRLSFKLLKKLKRKVSDGL